MTVIAPYKSSVTPARARGFGSLLLAEWTKLRTVRGFVAALLLVVLLPVGFTALARSGCSIMSAGGDSQPTACPGAPVGPDGEAVSDSFYFLHQALPADGSITAEVTGLTGKQISGTGSRVAVGQGVPLAPGTQPWSKAGIMIKASTGQGSAYAAMLVTGSNGTRMQWNYTGDAAGLPGNVSASSPRWLRLVRSGSVLTGYDSPNGTSWTRVGSYSVRGLPATGTVQVGLFAASPTHSTFLDSISSSSGVEGPSVATGTYRNVSVSGVSGSSWTGGRIGASSGPDAAPRTGPESAFDGSFTATGPSSFTVTGSGEIAPDVPGGPDGIGASVEVALAGVFVALIVVIILGALFIAAEYRRGMIRVTLAAAPSRWSVLAAKSVVIFLAAFVTGLVAASVTLPLGLHMLRAGGNPIDPLSAWIIARMIVGTALLLGVSAVLALAIGTMARRGVTAIAAVIVVIFIPYILVTGSGLLPLTVQDWMGRVLPVSAFSLQQAYPAYHQVLARYTPGNGYYPLSPWAGFAVLVAWAAVALAGAAWLLRRRDA